MAKLGNNGLVRLLTKISTWVNGKFNSLATVATSGSYNDLSNTPTIPTVNNGTLTIQQNGTNVGTFSANQSTNEEINIITGSNVTYATDADMAEMSESWRV